MSRIAKHLHPRFGCCMPACLTLVLASAYPGFSQQPVSRSQEQRASYIAALEARDSVIIARKTVPQDRPTIQREAGKVHRLDAERRKEFWAARSQARSRLKGETGDRIDKRPSGDSPTLAKTAIVNGVTTVSFTVNSAYDDPDKDTDDDACWTGFFLPNGDGECTLRAAIQEANVWPGTDAVYILIDIRSQARGGFPFGYDAANDVFRIPVDTMATGTAFGPLPQITRPNVEIDGETQREGSGTGTFPHASCETLVMGAPHTLKVVLDGALLDGVIGSGLVLAPSATGSSVRGLAIGNFPDRGIDVDADSATVSCVYVGSDVTGQAPAPNFIGVDYSGSAGSSLRNSLVSGNAAIGVEIAGGASGTTVSGSLIGTSSFGTSTLPNGGDGVEVNGGSDILIGGTTTSDWNLISGNAADGISIGSPNPGVVIEGNQIGTNLAGDGPLPNGSSGIIGFSNGTRIGGADAGAGNVISGNLGHGIWVFGDSTIVRGNFVGTNLAGTAALSNGADGVHVDGSHCEIGGVGAGNVISGNFDDGIELADSSNTVVGNLIGTSATGTSPIPNGFGVYVTANHNHVGGLAADSGNVISGNVNSGVLIWPDAYSARVSGNRIGTDISGTIPLGNGGRGIWNRGGYTLIGGLSADEGNLISANNLEGIRDDEEAGFTRVLGNLIGTNVSGTASISNVNGGVALAGSEALVGGIPPGSRNVISGHTAGLSPRGISIESTGTFTLIQSNYIGTDRTGTVAIPNGYSVWDEGTGTLIGGCCGAGNIIRDELLLQGLNAEVVLNHVGTDVTGTASLGNPGAGILENATNSTIRDNLISGNGSHGILVYVTSTNCTILSNLIGTDIRGLAPIPNALDGISDAGIGTMLGSTSIPGSNLIAFNGQDGINVFLNPTRTVILGNSIRNNGRLGIDLEGAAEGPWGETWNDTNDVDTGPNQYQNYPVIDPLVNEGGPTTLFGFSLHSTPQDTFHIEVFTNQAVDSSGFGEGENLFLSTEVITDAAGNATFPAFPISTSLMPVGSWVTATATRLRKDHGPLYTSEFSAAQQVVGPSVTFTGDVFLQGAYASGSMSIPTALLNAIPTVQPFSDPRFNGTELDYDGTELVASIPSSTIDWLLISLRTTTSPSDKIAERVAFVRSDGQIVDLDGSAPVTFYGVVPGSYYVVLGHRNHLRVMTSSPVTFSSATGAGTWSFTTAMSQAYTTGPDPMIDLGGGDFGMIGGDANADGVVQALDASEYLNQSTAGATGYEPADFNMDGIVDSQDLNFHLEITGVGGASRVP